MIRARTTAASASWEISGSDAVARGRARDRRLTVRAGLLASVATLCLGGVAASQNLPTGGAVAHGDVTIAQPGANTMTITQGTNSAIVNWNSFDIGAQAHVDIRQPGTGSSMLNRVTGATTSEIHGRLTANGQVHLVNPNGIFIGPNGTVDAGGFVASTLDIADEDFLAGRLSYRGTGNSARVENAGRVSIGRGGYAALLGGRVKNSGVVTVPMGRIAFGSGERAVLDLSGDQFLQVAVPTGGEDGDEALVENSGLASAQGGLIEMRAATAREAVRQAVNLSGVAEARSVSVRNGAIVLGGGAGGTVRVSGRVSTRSEPSALILDESPRPPRAPEITVTGHRIQLAGAEIDASGEGGGGLIRIGGDFAGQGDLPRADEVFVDDATVIRADALVEGDGGRIAIWSDLLTEFAGYASLRGGDTGGDGGFIEVSSKRVLRYSGLTDRRAPLGSWGTLLLDPTDITVGPGAGPNNEDFIETELAGGNLILDTSPDPDDVSGPDLGNITINADIDWSTGSTLTLIADNNIAINGAINGASGGLTIDADGTITAAGAVDVNTFVLSDGSWEQFGTAADFNAVNFQIDQLDSSFARTAGGGGSAEDPYQIFDVFGLQGIGTYTGDFVLIDDIDASGTADWINDVAEGFTPIGTLAGAFDGAGFNIDGLLIAPLPIGSPNAGLFDIIDVSGEVRNLTLTGVDVVGSTVGMLAAENNGVIDSVGVQGSVTGFDGTMGGLVGINRGTIIDSYAEASVSGPVFEGATAGGLVGLNSQGLIFRSHALGSVDLTLAGEGASASAGGFVGQAFFDGEEGASIANSYAQVNVSITDSTGGGSSGSSASGSAGGFAADIDLTIENSYSTGAVNVSMNPGGSSSTGGFVASDALGSSSGNFWDSETSGQPSSAVGSPLTTAEFQDTEGFILEGEAAGWDFFEVWAPGDTGFYPVNYSTSPVILAQPDTESASFEVEYGQTPTATSPGFVFGGPDVYVFDAEGDTLDETAVFQDLDYSEETVGFQTFTLGTDTVTSADGVVYRVVDRPGEVLITPAPLTIVAEDDTKTYGEVFTPTNFTVSGTLFFGDRVDAVDLISNGSAANAPVDPGEGDYDIDIDVDFEAEEDVADAVTGVGLENYSLDFIPGTLTINRAPLTITPNDQVKTFGNTFVFDGTEFTTSGFVVPGDGISDIFLVSAGAPADADVGSYPIVISGFDGPGIENYDVTEGEGTMIVQGSGDQIPRPPVTNTPGIQNPPDVIVVGTNGGAFQPAAGQSGTQQAAETLARTQDIAAALEIAADACGQSGGDVTRYLACLSDALDDFAAELDAISLDLPPGLENVAQIIQTARQQIDGAASRAAARLATATSDEEREQIRQDALTEARAALDTASNEIRKAITLVRAEDPELANLQRATITTVASAVDTVGIQLTRVAEL